MLDISKLLINLSHPAFWSLYSNYHFDTFPPSIKYILDAEIHICQAVNLHLLCNTKKVALGIRCGAEGLRIFPTEADPNQDLTSEKIPLLRAPDLSMWGILQQVPEVVCLVGYSEVCVPGVDMCRSLIARAMSFKMP